MRVSLLTVGLLSAAVLLIGCGLMVQGPAPETQICQGWWQWEEMTLDGASVGNQGVEAEGLSLPECWSARESSLAAWKELYRFTPHTAGECECKDIPPTKKPDMAKLKEAHQRVNALGEALNATLYAYSDRINDDFQTQVRTVADLEGFTLALERHEGPRFRSAKLVLETEAIYEELKHMESMLKEMHEKPLRQIDTLVGRTLGALVRLEQRQATVEKQFKEYYSVEKFWFGSDEDGVLSGPFQSQEAVRGGRPLRLRYVWYLYRPKEKRPFLFFEDKARCEAGMSFWQGTGCGVAPTTDLEIDALRRGDRVDFKQSSYAKYQLQ